MDEEMLRLIANPHRLKPARKPIQEKPSLNTKIHYLLKDVYPDLYVSETLVDSVCEDIGNRIKEEAIDSVVGELVDQTIRGAINGYTNQCPEGLQSE
jgi:hypothetical protein